MVYFFVNPNEVKSSSFIKISSIDFIILAEEKILNMRHILSDGSTLQLSQLTRSLFQPIQCIINGQLVQINEINQALQQAIPFLHASGRSME